MATLSNLLFGRDASAAEDAEPPRVARDGEVDEALRLILTGQGDAGRQARIAFAARCARRGTDLELLYVVTRRRKIAWAALPVPNGARGAMVLAPSRLRPGVDEARAAAVLTAALAALRAKSDVTAAQALVPPEATHVRAAFAQAGFEPVADLLYLVRKVDAAPPQTPLPPGWGLLPWRSELHARFVRAAERSYVGSLDCPALDAQRTAADTLDAHRTAGEPFDADLWRLLVAPDGDDAGLLLVSRLGGGAALELTYVGLAPEHRGRGLGDALLRRALADAAGAQLVLAVDAANAPARRAYARHGFGEMYQRVALVKFFLVPSPGTPGEG